ncbi:hypothetical protein B1A99_06735 [Cohnella sp. CIP 111063]|uniref:hypothetical protein n=1 Tax=unclassified Cohnella TaxID=2636738 RepID=UPI000B8BBDB6|nr:MULTISPECIES: hypothetical protein [unclassified Cohnella]OXS61205.1 hypothetical protein B1A99_06735 [Cohnella sp. CIP 111063]PRX73770.1 hypothetical protein B0G52_103370 [Cohnella sp. SGD-V74]
MKVRFWQTSGLALAALLLVALTGCLYPEDRTPRNDATAREAVLTVQDAVDRYREQTGVLPIQNADETVPLYEKYKVDLGKLKRMGFIGHIPSAAFENGGNYQFLVVNEETKPLVRLLDVTAFQAVDGVQKKMDQYRSSQGNRLAAGDEMYPGFRSVDFAKLGMKDPGVRSMFSNQTLNWLVDEQGKVYADYGIDIATAAKKTGTEPAPNEDLRRVLIEESYYVPVRAPEYRWIDGDPQAIVP